MSKAKRPTFSGFKKKALKDSGVKAKYDELSPVYEMKRKLIGMRKERGKTQEKWQSFLALRKVVFRGLKACRQKVHRA